VHVQVGEIIKRFEQKGFHLVALKLATPSQETLKAHYADLSAKAFFPGLITYMSSGPVVCMVWEGRDAVKTGRRMLGETNPANSAPGTIRGDYCVEVGRCVPFGDSCWWCTFLYSHATVHVCFCVSVPVSVCLSACTFYRTFLLTSPHSNICHGSDSVESAQKEISLWFKPEELSNWTSCEKGWLYE
jgi:nucleoside-diphosphate kinase